MVVVALMAEAGFTGNLRYVALPAALVCVLGGIGLPGVVEAVRRRGAVGLAAMPLAALAAAFSCALLVRNGLQLAEEERVYGRQLGEVIERLGGAPRIRACGPVGASAFETQAVAYRLDLRQADVRRGTTQARGTVLARAGTTVARDGVLPVRLRHGDWVVRHSCPPPRRGTAPLSR
jgi:hypothetical protein